jgi:hypothetical protein
MMTKDDERSEHRRGFDEGVLFALSMLKTEHALTGAQNAGLRIALETVLSAHALAALPNGPAKETP